MERKKASDYPQELLDLFHEYQHGDIDRRSFLERAGKFAVGGLTAAAILSETEAELRLGRSRCPKDDPRIKAEYRDRAVARRATARSRAIRQAGEDERQAARRSSSSTRTAG